ncbi:dienelactone hydrolase family protein [Luedemannella helvata]|uniref:Dienelactone hydrolase family protein n=1 Tax=Luedemannella helvata TaxID=349315 RepID=A0ABP4X8S3_9ACTN
MGSLGRYLAEEIAVDHADGLLNRREALRRLGLLGVTGVAASTLLAACGGGAKDGSGSAAASTGGGPPAGPTPRPVVPVSYPDPTGTMLNGAWSEPEAEPLGGVLVIHENKGLTDHIRSVAGRFAASGYAALAPDLLSREGGTAAIGDPAKVTATLGTVAPARLVADLRSALAELSVRVEARKLGTVGFCFGGGLVWRLLAAGEPKLSAAVPFYGPLPDKPDFSRSGAAVLAVYAESDARVNASRDAAEAALTAAGLPHDVVTYPGVDHAFFNDTGPRYNAEAAADAYQRVLNWFERYVAT